MWLAVDRRIGNGVEDELPEEIGGGSILFAPAVNRARAILWCLAKQIQFCAGDDQGFQGLQPGKWDLQGLG